MNLKLLRYYFSETQFMMGEKLQATDLKHFAYLQLLGLTLPK